MFVRLLAILVMLGLVASSVQASDLTTPPAAALSADVAIDMPDDNNAEVDLVPVAVAPPDAVRTITAVALPTQAPRYQHCLYVFRPPRASAFV